MGLAVVVKLKSAIAAVMINLVNMQCPESVIVWINAIDQKMG